MEKSVVVISDNVYFKMAIATMIKERKNPYRKCSGIILIVDVSNAGNLNSYKFPDHICHAIYFLAKDEHKRLLSTLNFTFPVSYVSEKCSPEHLTETIYNKTIDLRRRLSCKRYYNDIPEYQLQPKEIFVVEKLLQGKNFNKISEEMGMNSKTVKNYQSLVFSKAFKRLDSNSLRMFRFYKELKNTFDRNKSRSP